MIWFVVKENEHSGPFDESELRELSAAGAIDETTHIWREGMDSPRLYVEVFPPVNEAVPVQEKEEQQEEEKQQEEEEEEDAAPPPLPPEVLQAASQKLDSNLDSNVDEESFELPPLPEQEVPALDEIELDFEESFFAEAEARLEDSDESNGVDEEPPQDERADEPTEVVKLEDIDASIEIEENELDQDEAKEPELELVLDPGEEVWSDEEPKRPSFAKRLLRLVLWGLVLLVLLVAALIGAGRYQVRDSIASRPAQLAPQEYERLKKAAISDPTEQVFAFALSPDQNFVWMAVNSPLEGPVSIRLESLPRRILSESPVVLTASGELRGKLANLNFFEFDRGQKLVQGWYRIKFSSANLEEPPLVKILSSLAELSPFLKHFQVDQELAYEGEALLTTMRERDFNKALEQFNQRKKDNESAFWEELREKYRSIGAISQGMREELEQVFVSEGGWEEKLQNFKREYPKKFGNFFTAFVIQNDQSYQDLEAQDFPDKAEVLAAYSRLSRLAKEAGATAMRSLALMEKRASEAEEQKLLAQIREDFDRLKSKLEEGLR